VFVASNRGGMLLTLVLALTLGGCANTNLDTTGAWFPKPLDLFGIRGGYTYSNLDNSIQDHPITAKDLVDANGACPNFAETGAPPSQTAQQNEAANAGNASEMASLLGGGVAIGMSECDVVARLGQPSAVNLGRNPNGDRTAALTFNAGPRPGLYRFTAGRLAEMDRVEEPRSAEPTKKKMVKKKAATPKQPATTTGGNT
jgi:hypothetical protein